MRGAGSTPGGTDCSRRVLAGMRTAEMHAGVLRGWMFAAWRDTYALYSCEKASRVAVDGGGRYWNCYQK